MAIKKSELYSSLYQACDNLRGGMDPSQYKNYILTLLFVKYVTDKFKDDPYGDVVVPEGGNFDTFAALRGKKDIGQGMDVALQALAEANPKLTDIFREVHFNDPTKLGNGQEMVDKLTKLVNIFLRPEFDFKNNKASGDDILGDAYEYLMRKFAVDSGKSKGQFYTPGEASRVLAGVLGIANIQSRSEGWSIYDCACGSGSLLIRAADTASVSNVAIFGQELDVMTAGLAKMNLVLHNRATGDIQQGNTFAEPKFFAPNSNEQILQTFDFAVVNPPFSHKTWTNGLKPYGRFDGYQTMPPEKNGDYAWLMHVLKSLKSTGRAAVILPLGVLFRGNAEGEIRREIIDRGYIEGIISLPANIFYGTSIPACILVISKADADKRTGIFMIDASRDFVKDGNKNRLRERDINKIVMTYNERIEEPHYSRFVPNSKIKGEKNRYNLNVPRYIDSGVTEDIQSIDAHLNGGIPNGDIDALSNYWHEFPSLKQVLFEPCREGFQQLRMETDAIRETIKENADFKAYNAKVASSWSTWVTDVEKGFSAINHDVVPKSFIEPFAKKLLPMFEPLSLLDKHDVYEVLLSYWNETMSDDVYAIVSDGYEAGREWVNIVEETFNKKKKEFKTKIVGWDGRIIPKAILDRVFFGEELAAIAKARMDAEAAASAFDEFVEAETEESGLLFDYVTKAEDGKEEEDVKIKLETKRLSADFKKLKKSAPHDEETLRLAEYFKLEKAKKDTASELKRLIAALEALEKAKYPTLTMDELKTLIVKEKWLKTIEDGVFSLYTAVSNKLSERVTELAERYAETLPELDEEGKELETEFFANLKAMGY